MTAEELIDKRVGTRSKWVSDLMVEFAKFHVKAALEAAYDNSLLRIDDGEVNLNERCDDGMVSISVDKESIIKAYEPENIK